MRITQSDVFQTARNMRKGPFAQDIAKLFSGKLFAQAVGFASIILLARLYSPEAFGVLGVFMAVA